jgi:hypothetical protein
MWMNKKIDCEILKHKEYAKNNDNYEFIKKI